jgi:hypothetical protein
MQTPDTSEDEVLYKGADTHIDEPITIAIDIEPTKWYHPALMAINAIPKQQVFKVKGATMRTMLKISKLLLKLNYTPMPEPGNGLLDWAYQGVVDNLELSVKIIAAAIHNKNSEHPQSLEDLLFDNMDAKEHRKIAFNIINKLDVLTFMSTITSIRTINILKKVSLEPEELIAPENTITGEELETLSNILASAIPK